MLELAAPLPSVPAICICNRCGKECSPKLVEITDPTYPQYPYIRSHDVPLSDCCTWTYHTQKLEPTDG